MTVESQCCKVKLNNFITQDPKTLYNQRMFLKIHWKSLKYTKGKLTEARKTAISYVSSIGSSNGCTPLLISMMIFTSCC